MSVSSFLRSVVAALFHRSRVESEMEEEIRAHMEDRANDLERSGVPRAEAERRARLEFGGYQKFKEECREALGAHFLETLLQDIQYGSRMLRKSPGFTAVTVFTLTLGIGANAAIFSVVQAVILEPLPYPGANRLVMVWERVHLPTYQSDQNDPAPGNFADWRAQSSAFEDMAAIQDKSFNLTGDGEPLRVEGEAVSASLFPLLQVQASLGRTFTAGEDVPGGPHVVVMGHGLWTSRYGSDPQILKKSILLDGVSYQVIGVMPSSFRFPDPANFHASIQGDQLWIPIALSPADLSNRGSHYLQGVMGRLKPHVTLSEAQSQLEGIAERLTQQHPDSNKGVGVNVIALQEALVGNVETELWILFGAVSLVLLMICANVANLLLVRASTRERELALRIALGARRIRVLRQLLTESVLLALIGGCAGVVFAGWGVHVLQSLRAFQTVGPSGLPQVGELGIGTPVLGFSLVISLLAGLIFGIAPVLQLMRSGVQDSLKGGLRKSDSSARLNLRDALVVAETALGVVVVVGAALLLRSFVLLQQTPLGFDTALLLTFRAIPRSTQYSQPEQRVSFYREALARIRAASFVESAGAVSFLPLTFYQASQGFSVEGRPNPASDELPMALYEVVSPGFFQTMRIPLIEGRDVTWNDAPQGFPVVVINEAMARMYWPNEIAIGRRIKEGRPDDKLPWLTIVGVVGNFRDFDVARQPRPTIFYPVSQFAGGTGLLRDWAVRAAGDPLAMASGVREAIWHVDKDMPVSRVQSMDQVRSNSLAEQQFTLLLLGLFAILALIIAIVGLYGVTAYAAAQRTREIGIRMALGAQRRDVMRMILFHGASIGLLGVAIGIVAALAFARLMRSLLYGVGATDPLSFGGVAILVATVTLVACYVPARRAMRVDPIVALRYE